MSPEERKALAESLDANPLFHELFDAEEANAIERLIHAETEIERIRMQERVKSARAIRSDCQALLDSTRERKGAPA